MAKAPDKEQEATVADPSPQQPRRAWGASFLSSAEALEKEQEATVADPSPQQPRRAWGASFLSSINSFFSSRTKEIPEDQLTDSVVKAPIAELSNKRSTSQAEAAKEEEPRAKLGKIQEDVAARVCSVCREAKPRPGYSKTQWAARGNVRKCSDCVAAAAP